MKKVFSMFLILIMILPLLPANASENTCLIEFDGVTPTYSLSGTLAYIEGHHNDNAPVEAVSGKSGWCLTPTNSFNTICINLANSYMHELNGNRDVLMDVCYYDGDSSDAGNKFCVFYISKNHHNENAGVITLTGSGTWKTHTFVLEKPRLVDFGNAPLKNISISVKSSYMGTSKGEVIIASANVYYGEERELFFTLDSENVGNIFFNNDPIILDMILENPFAVNHGDLTVKLTLVDKLTSEEYETEKTVSIGRAVSRTEHLDLRELNLPFGLYEVSADIYNGDRLVISDVTELSRINARGSNEPSLDGVNNNFLGINTHAARYSSDTVKDYVYLAKRSGVGFIRTTLGWESIEKSEGQYVIPGSIMTLIEEAKKNNLKIMATLGNRRTDIYPNYKPWRTGSTEDNFQGYLEKYSDYVEYTVTQLKDYVECWEIYNEYGLSYPGYDITNDTIAAEAARDYSDILKAGYEAVKNADPDAIVVGGVFDMNSSPVNFSETLFDTYDAADYMDVLSFHTYCNGSDTSGEIRTLNTYENRFNGFIDTYGDNQELYLDEFNFNMQAGLSQEEQALYNVRLLTKQRHDGAVDRIYLYNLDGTEYNLKEGLGFLVRPQDDYDYIVKTSSARPNYAAFAFMNKLLRLSDSIDFTEDAKGNYIYEFYDNIHQRPVYVIWNKTESNTNTSSVTIEDEGTELFGYDMYGNELGSGDGSLTVTTGRKPVYIAGPEKDLTFSQDDETYKVTISGEGTKGDSISIVVLNKGIDEDEFTSVDNILYLDQKPIDSYGAWEFTFKITQGNGAYTILVKEESGIIVTYNLNYNAGNLRIGYELLQEHGGVENFSSLTDGNLDINYRIDNPENKKTPFLVFGCLYKGDELIKVVKSPDGQLNETDLIKTGAITIPDVKKSEIDKLQIMVIDGTDNLCPLVKKFVLE